nr:putative ribonuclease H-like domain-containing protein [Tanacetum cinerariifolium]
PEGSGNPNPIASTSNPPANQMETLTVETPIPTVNESNGVEADISNMETAITASPTPTLKIHKDHPKSQIIGPLDTPIQTRNKSKKVEEQSFIATIHQKTNPALLQFCLFSCLLSQVQPKKISNALQDPSWVEAMQDELLQFKIQNVWTLVDCPKGVRPIGTKWVLKNKKDERGIVIRNKARLVAQGHTQEEGIDYDEVFALVARIKAIRLFLAYASFIGFTVYQMDMKRAFLYGIIDEEVYVMQPPGFQDPEFPAKVYKVEKAMLGMPYEALSREITPSILFLLHTAKTFDLVWIWLGGDYGNVFLMGFNGIQCNSIMARLQLCDYHNMVAILEKSEHNVDFHPMVDFIEASPLRIETTEEGTQILATVDGILRTVIESSLRRNFKLQDEEGISSLPDIELFENLTLMGYNGEGSGTPTEPQHTPSPKAQPTSHTTHSSPTLPPVTTTSIPAVTPSDTTPIKQYTRRARIAQSSALPTVANEPESPLRDISQGEAYPTNFGFIANQDRVTIAKFSTLPHDSAPRVTSPAADEGSMKHTINDLTALCTSLQRQYSELAVKFEAQEIKLTRLKARVKLLEDSQGVVAVGSRDDAPIKGRNLDEGEAAAERASDETEEMATVLTSKDAAIVLARGVAEVPTCSGFIPTAGPLASEVPNGSDVVPTANPVFSTATVVTPYRRRKGKEVMVESETPKKQKVQEQIDAQVARELEEQQEREDQRRSKLGWKVKDFRGSKEEAKRIKRKGLSLEQESAKKQKTSEEVTEDAKSSDEVPKEKRNFHASGERLPSKEGSSTCDDQLQASSGKLLTDGE